tara:strand:+ start:327 stop:452 length:126 start_codon:yes stop_codon:yes gene_type:complete
MNGLLILGSHTPKEACLKLKLIDEEAFDKIVDPKKMIKPSN